MRKLILLAGAALFAAVPANAAVIDFETTAGGSPTVTGTSVGSDYAALGITFTDAVYFQCGGGCPPPPNGHFVSGAGYGSFSVEFAGTTDAFSFDNVSFSAGSASAFDLFGALLQTVSFSAYPSTHSFSVTGIHSVTFSSGSQYGVDNFVFGAITAAVPEPATWAMMLLGFGGIGMAMRRSRRSDALMQVA